MCVLLAVSVDCPLLAHGKLQYNMTTRQQFAIRFATALGNPIPSKEIVRFISAWTVGEGTKARYNPLATTQPMPGATNFNTANVKDYLTAQQGIDASVITLKNGRYPHILHGILTNDVNEAMNDNELGVWGTGLSGVKNAYDSDRRIEGEGLPSYTGLDTATADVSVTPAEKDPALAWLTGKPTNDATAKQLGNSVIYFVVGGTMLVLSVILAIKSFVPTQQVVKTIAAVA